MFNRSAMFFFRERTRNEYSGWWLLFKEGDFFREIEENIACMIINIQLRISHISTKTRIAT